MNHDLREALELLPCPFCGAAPYLYTRDGNDVFIAVRCNGCGTTTADFRNDPGNSEVFTGEPAAIAAWNRRTHGEEIERRMGGWQPVRGFEGKYEVAANGAVRKVGGAILGQWPNADGYMLVRLTSDAGDRSLGRVHRLVAEAFVPNPTNLPFVNHIDNDRANNASGNLEWCTQEQNLAHMTAQGRRASPWKGKRSPNARLSDETVRQIREAYAEGGVSHSELAAEHGISKRTVGKIIKGQSYV